MKRKDLQVLCKKHRIPANLSNLEMAKRLMEFSKENGNFSIQGLKNVQDENASETESTNLVMERKVKKVRFSPEHELIEFPRSPKFRQRTRRTFVSIRNSSLSVENLDSSQMNRKNVNRQSRVTRSRGLKMMEGQVIEKKRGTKGVKLDEPKSNVSTTEIFDNNELRMGNSDVTSRVLRSRGKKLNEGAKNAKKRGKVKGDDKNHNEKDQDDADDGEVIEAVVGSHGRLTRSRKNESSEVPTTEAKRVKIIVDIDHLTNVPRRSSRNKERCLGERNNGNVGSGVSEKTRNAEANRIVEPQIVLRRYGNCEIKASRKSVNLLAADTSAVGADSKIIEFETDEKALQIEEPVKPEVRRSHRRKEANALRGKEKNGELKAEEGNMHQSMSSVPQLVIAGGVSKRGKKATQPIMRRSRRETIILERKNKARKRKRAPVSQGYAVKTKNDTSVSDNSGHAENSSSAESVLLADPEVTKVKVDTHKERGSDCVDEVEGISVQEKLETVETGQANVLSSLVTCHHDDVDHMEASIGTCDGNEDDRPSKDGEVGASESCGTHANCVNNKDELADACITDLDISMDLHEKPNDVESRQSWTDNQLKLLFATPIKIDSPFNVDETCCNEEKLDGPNVSITEYGTAKEENKVAQVEVQVSENEHEIRLCFESSSDDGEEINYEELNEVELLNTLENSDSIIEEIKKEDIFSLGQTCFYEEARDKFCELTEKNTIISSGSLRNLDTLEGCEDKFCYEESKLSETFIETIKDSEVEKFGSINDEATDDDIFDNGKSDVETPPADLGGDHDKSDKEEEEEEEKIATVEFPILELQSGENDLRTKNDVPAFGCNDLLKESDVADTIMEYVDSELTLNNEMTTFEDDLQSVESLGTGSHEPDEATCVDLHVGESAGNDALVPEKEESESKDGERFSSGQSFTKVKLCWW